MIFSNLTPVLPLPPTRVAWYVTGRFYATAPPSPSTPSIQDLGYFLHVEGIEQDLFTGPIGEATALLTFRSSPFTSQAVTNGDLSVGLDTVGDFSLYLNRQPGGDFNDPDSFSQGEKVATFRRTGVVVGVTLNGPQIVSNVFSAVPVSTTPFQLGSKTYDFAELLPAGITQFGTASATSLPAVGPFTTVLPFVGSAIAAGLSNPPGGLW